MHTIPHPQQVKLDALIRSAAAGRGQAARGLLFCSHAGYALVNAAFDLFECDGLYDLAQDVAHELRVENTESSIRQRDGGRP